MAGRRKTWNKTRTTPIPKKTRKPVHSASNSTAATAVSSLSVLSSPVPVPPPKRYHVEDVPANLEFPELNSGNVIIEHFRNDIQIINKGLPTQTERFVAGVRLTFFNVDIRDLNLERYSCKLKGDSKIEVMFPALPYDYLYDYETITSAEKAAKAYSHAVEKETSVNRLQLEKAVKRHNRIFVFDFTEYDLTFDAKIYAGKAFVDGGSSDEDPDVIGYKLLPRVGTFTDKKGKVETYTTKNGTEKIQMYPNTAIRFQVAVHEERPRVTEGGKKTPKKDAVDEVKGAFNSRMAELCRNFDAKCKTKESA